MSSRLFYLTNTSRSPPSKSAQPVTLEPAFSISSMARCDKTTQTAP